MKKLITCLVLLLFTRFTIQIGECDDAENGFYHTNGCFYIQNETYSFNNHSENLPCGKLAYFVDTSQYNYIIGKLDTVVQLNLSTFYLGYFYNSTDLNWYYSSTLEVYDKALNFSKYKSNEPTLGDECTTMKEFNSNLKWFGETSAECLNPQQAIYFCPKSCESGYFGDTCESFFCFNISNEQSSSCTINGECIDIDKCNCTDGYYGERCENFTCYDIASENFDEVCNGNGNCFEIDNCTCNTGYYGLNCSEFYYCFDILKNSSEVCNENKGDCIGYNKCDCKTKNYYGEECKEKIVEIKRKTENFMEIKWELPIEYYADIFEEEQIKFDCSLIVKEPNLNDIADNLFCTWNDYSVTQTNNKTETVKIFLFNVNETSFKNLEKLKLKPFSAADNDDEFVEIEFSSVYNANDGLGLNVIEESIVVSILVISNIILLIALIVFVVLFIVNIIQKKKKNGIEVHPNNEENQNI